MAQVFLVTGGYSVADWAHFHYDYYASTELLVEGDVAWFEAGPLPSARVAPRAVSSLNTVIVTGGRFAEDDDHPEYEYHDSVLRFDPSSLQWQQVAAMARPRSHHAMSMVRVQDIQEYCV